MKSVKIRSILWVIFRWALFSLAVLATLIVLTYSALSYFGRKQWAKVQADLRANGEKLSLVELAPPHIPDEENFFAAPIWREILELEPAVERDGTTIFKAKVPDQNGRIEAFKKALNLGDQSALTATKRSLERGQAADLGEAADRYRAARLAPTGLPAAQTILTALNSAQAELRELEQAASRPGANPNLILEGNAFRVPLPHLSAAMSIGQYLSVRILAEAAAGQGGEAQRDLFLLLRLADALKSDSLMISFLVRISILSMVAQSVWDGMEFECWNENQLKEIQKRLNEINLSPDFANSLRAERGGATQTLESYARKGGMAQMVKDMTLMADFPKQPDNWEVKVSVFLAGLYPEGLLFQSLAIYSQLIQEMIAELEIDPFRLSFGESVRGKIEKLQAVPSRVFYPLIAMSAPVLSGPQLRVVHVETRLRQAQIAIALERYRLADGQYPESLWNLVPTFLKDLPIDPGSRKNFRYRKEGADQFVLWSVGPDQIDNNAAPTEKSSSQTGDWVWRTPPRATDAKSN